MQYRNVPFVAKVLVIVISQIGCGSGANSVVTPPPASPPPAPPPPPTAAPVATVTLAGVSGPLVALQTATATATLRDAAGNVLTGRTITWSSSNPGIATVSSTGVITAASPGSTTITATTEGQSGVLNVMVQSGLYVGSLGGVLTAVSGHLQLTVPAGALASSVALTAAANATAPQATGLVAGTAYDITPLGTVFATPATLKLVYDAASVAAGAQPAQFRLEQLSGSNWALVSGSTVDVNSRTVTGTITAAGTYAIIEIPAPVASVVVTAPRTSLSVGDAVQYSAVAKDALGNTLAGRAITWSSTVASVATVSSSGNVTAIAPGTTIIRAASEGVTSDVAVQVANASSVIEQHALAQQGLAIALASTVLQSQIEVLLTVGVTGGTVDNSCQVAEDGSSYRLTSGFNTPPYDVTVYYDGACVRPYMVEHVSQKIEDQVANSTRLVATATYKGPTGTTLGSMAFDETAYGTANNGITVSGLGVFTPADGTPAAHLGLNCAISSDSYTVPCQGGIVQNFAALNRALGSVTPLTLQIATSADASGNTPVTFAGGSTLLSGALNSMTLVSASPTSMVINGTSSSIGATSDAGGAATFSLFPPTPTAWSVTDAGNDQKFAISVVSNTTRNSVATISRISTGATLATANLDQSGSGTITYSDGTTSSVSSWVIAQ
jgi:hypothetical protein